MVFVLSDSVNSYLVVDHEFSYYDDKNARIVLFGADHKLKPRTFVNAESIQRSEIIEYAKMQVHILSSIVES